MFQSQLVPGDRERRESRKLMCPGERCLQVAEPVHSPKSVEPLRGVGLRCEQHCSGNRG